LYRHYSNNYRQLWGAAMAESSSMQGEQGATLLIDGSLNHGWQLQGTADCWHFTQPQYGCYQKSWGYELSARALWNGTLGAWPSDLSLRYRMKAKQKNNTLTEKTDDVYGCYLHSVDSRFSLEVYEGLVLRTQARMRLYNAQIASTNEVGWAVGEAIVWQQKNSPIKGEVQGAWFKANDYNCRLYFTERNILYGFSMPMLYGEGMRVSATMSYKISERIQAEAKYALTNYKNQSKVGSGLQTIEGCTKHDL
ncbi:MAG: hypothetical protein Q4B58_05175, partial [Bacteroidales bacterium]|nr:hypothetical protein [Bacteroidales bacterium]